MVVLDFTIVNIALPSIERDLGVAASAVRWVVTGYAIAFSGLPILGGRAAGPVLLVLARAVQPGGTPSAWPGMAAVRRN